MDSRARSLLYAGAVLTLVVGVVHIQQYLDIIGDVPTIAELFVLNGIGAGVIVAALMTPLRVPAAVAGIGLSAGALVSLAIARYADAGLFDYVETSFRAPVVISIVAELGAVLALAAYLIAQRRSPAGSSLSAG